MAWFIAEQNHRFDVLGRTNFCISAKFSAFATMSEAKKVVHPTYFAPRNPRPLKSELQFGANEIPRCFLRAEFFGSAFYPATTHFLQLI
jgi:hypothetical protein